MIVAPPKPRACDDFGTAPQRRSLAQYVPATQDGACNLSPAVASDFRGSDVLVLASRQFGVSPSPKPNSREGCSLQLDPEVACSSTARRGIDRSADSLTCAHEALAAGSSPKGRDRQALERRGLDESSIRCEQAMIMVDRGFSQGGVDVEATQRTQSAERSITLPQNLSSTLDGLGDASGSSASSPLHQCKEHVPDEIRCCANADETPRSQTHTSTLRRHSCGDVVTEDRPRVDILTVRQWFNEMDREGDGYVAKQTFLSTLRDVAWFRQLLVHKERRRPSAEKQTRMEFSLELRHGLRFWREMDSSGKNIVYLDDFVEGFRRSGLLLEYDNSENPRTKIAELMGDLNNHGTSKTESEPMENLKSLVKQHLCSDSMRRQSLRTNAREERMETMEMETVRSSLRASVSVDPAF